MVRDGDDAVIVFDELRVNAQALVVEGLVQFAKPQRAVMRVGDDHDIPFGRLAGRRKPHHLADVARHVSRRIEIERDVEPVFFVKRRRQVFGAFRAQS